MDLFSQFPESGKQLQYIERISDEKSDLNSVDDKDIDKENNKKSKIEYYEEMKKVNKYRKRNFLILILMISSFFAIILALDKILEDFSVYLIENYGGFDKYEKIFFYINKFLLFLFYPLFLILYLKYPLTYSFSYITCYIIIKYIISLLELIYGIDREKEKGIKEFFVTNSEKPNSQLVLIFIIYFGFWRLIKAKHSTKKSIISSGNYIQIFFIISVLVTIYTFLEEILVAKCSINFCLIGLIISILTYSIIYERLCIQFMKGKYFVKWIKKNIFLFVFICFINISVSSLIYHNYQGIRDIFRVFEYNPFSPNIQTQDFLNNKALLDSLIIFLELIILFGIKSNYEFVVSKENKNFCQPKDIVQFNRDEKFCQILKNNLIFTLPGTFIIFTTKYLQYQKEKLPLLFYGIADILTYLIYGCVFYGCGIRKLLKNHVNEGEELSNYHNLDISGSSKHKNQNIISNTDINF